MTDAELIARLRELDGWVMLGAHTHLAAADRIEQLVATNEALTKERDTAREYAGEVRIREKVADDARIEAEAKLATCEKYRDAYAEMGRIGTQAVRDLEAKLAKAVEALELIVVDSTWGLEHQTYMKCRKALAAIKGETK